MGSFPPIAFIPGINGGEMVVLFVVILILFGPKRLPEITKTIGRVLEQLRRASQEFKDQVMQMDVEPEKKPVERPALVPDRENVKQNEQHLRFGTGFARKLRRGTQNEQNKQNYSEHSVNSVKLLGSGNAGLGDKVVPPAGDPAAKPEQKEDKHDLAG